MFLEICNLKRRKAGSNIHGSYKLKNRDKR